MSVIKETRPSIKSDSSWQISDFRNITRLFHSLTDGQDILKVASSKLSELFNRKVVVCLRGQNPESALNKDELGYALDQAAAQGVRVDINGKHRIYAWPLTTPIGNDIGMLGIVDHAQKRLSKNDLLFIEYITEQLALALESALLLSQTQRALKESASLYQIITGLNSAQDYGSILKAITIHTILNQADQFVMMGLFDSIPEQDNYPEWIIPIAHDSLAQVQLASRYPVNAFEDTPGKMFIKEPVLIENTEIDKRVDRITRTLFLNIFQAKSILIIPLMVGEYLIGFVMGSYGELMKFPQIEVERLNAVANQVAIAVQRLQLSEKTMERAQQEKFLREITTKLVSAHSIEEVLKLAVCDIGNVFNRRAYIQVGLPKFHQGYVFENDQVHSFIGNGSKFTFVDNWSSRSRIIATSSLAISIKVRDESVGFLGLKNDTEFTVSHGDFLFLQSVADQVAHSLERARLMDQAYKSSLELQTVAQVSAAASTILDPKELLQSVVDLAKNRFNLYHAQIYLIDDSETQLYLAAWTRDLEIDFVSPAWTFLISENGLVPRAGRTRKGQIVNDVGTTSDYVNNLLLPDTASELAIPMIVGQKLIGVFNAHSNLPGRFTEDDIQTFTTLATQTAIAWQNARLFSEQVHTVERLRELDNLKNSFLANMSHELRTPLNSILGFTQVILEELDGPITDYMRSDLRLIEKSSHHLLKLINEILDMAKIESGRVSLARDNFDFRDLIIDVMESIAPQAHDKSLYLKLESRGLDDLIIVGDEMRLRQVLINLIGNSVKFTEVGGITLSINRLPDYLHIQIQDTGIGIPPEMLEMIFEAFTQVDSSTTRKAGGTGLGLPISRRLIELHGGKLYVESKGIPGEGSTFHIELPIKP